MTGIFLAVGLAPGPAAHAAPDLSITSVSPDVFGAPTVAQVDIAGTGLSTDDTVTDATQPDAVTFSSLADDGEGGLTATATINGPAPSSPRQDDITVTDPQISDSATCVECLTVESHPDSPVLTTETPATTTLALAWRPSDTTSHAATYEVSWTPSGPPAGPTQITTVTAASHTHDGAVTISGLTKATPYVITIASHDVDGTVGQALQFIEEVGATPEQPTLVGSNTNPCCGSISVLGLDASTWTTADQQHWVFKVFPIDHAPEQTYRPSSNFFSANEPSERGYVVTATVANQIGRSVPSDPITVKPVVIPGPPRDEVYRYSHGILTIQWSPPSRDGNAPIREYHVTVDGGHGSNQHRLLRTTTTGTSVSARVAPGLAFEANVIPTNRAGNGPGEVPELQGATSLGVVTGLDDQGRGRWRYEDRGGWRSLGGHFAAPPVAFIGPGHRLMFVAANSDGRAQVRSVSRGWRSLSPIHCYQPTATATFRGIDIACRSFDDTLEVSMGTRLRHGLPRVPSSASRSHGGWDHTGIHLVGGPQASGQSDEPAWIAFRVRRFDSAGHDVEAISDAHSTKRPKVHRIRLACTGDPATSTFEGAAVACTTGPHRIAWRSLVERGPTEAGSLSVPWQIVGRIGAAGYDQGLAMYLTTSDPTGLVHVLDPRLHLGWTLGSSGAGGIGMLAFRG